MAAKERFTPRSWYVLFPFTSSSWKKTLSTARLKGRSTDLCQLQCIHHSPLLPPHRPCRKHSWFTIPKKEAVLPIADPPPLTDCQDHIHLAALCFTHRPKSRLLSHFYSPWLFSPLFSDLISYHSRNPRPLPNPLLLNLFHECSHHVLTLNKMIILWEHVSLVWAQTLINIQFIAASRPFFPS